MIEQLMDMNPAARVLVLAFNVDAASQLRARVPCPATGAVDVHTLHSYGMRLQIAASTHSLSVDADKVLHKWQCLRNTGSLSGVMAMAEWRRVHAHVDRIRHSGRVPALTERPLALDDAVLEATMLDGATIDQDDQIYQCLVQGMKLDPAAAYDLILVDEAQDLDQGGMALSPLHSAWQRGESRISAPGGGAAHYEYRGVRGR
jgi:hypothetical protein